MHRSLITHKQCYIILTYLYYIQIAKQNKQFAKFNFIQYKLWDKKMLCYRSKTKYKIVIEEAQQDGSVIINS